MPAASREKVYRVQLCIQCVVTRIQCPLPAMHPECFYHPDHFHQHLSRRCFLFFLYHLPRLVNRFFLFRSCDVLQVNCLSEEEQPPLQLPFFIIQDSGLANTRPAQQHIRHSRISLQHNRCKQQPEKNAQDKSNDDKKNNHIPKMKQERRPFQ